MTTSKSNKNDQLDAVTRELIEIEAALMSDDDWFNYDKPGKQDIPVSSQSLVGKQRVAYKPYVPKPDWNILTLVFPWGPSQIFGGPYRDKPNDMVGINLTKEISNTGGLHLPIPDFNVPVPEEAEKILVATLGLMAAGIVPYAGCGWGKGRTGLFLALLTKVADRSVTPWYRNTQDPVTRVRSAYRKEAVETKAQDRFVQDFNVSRLVKLVKVLGK